MATSRTGTSRWKNLRRRTLHEAKSSGHTADNVRVICRKCNPKRGAGETVSAGPDAFPLSRVW